MCLCRTCENVQQNWRTLFIYSLLVYGFIVLYSCKFIGYLFQYSVVRFLSCEVLVTSEFWSLPFIWKEYLKKHGKVLKLFRLFIRALISIFFRCFGDGLKYKIIDTVHPPIFSLVPNFSGSFCWVYYVILLFRQVQLKEMAVFKIFMVFLQFVYSAQYWVLKLVCQKWGDA